MYKTVLRPVLTFASELWTLSRSEQSKIQAIEMKYLRRVLRITREHRIPNDQIRETLQVEPIIDYINRKKLSWFGHLTRMNKERQTRKIWEARTINKRGRGRPAESWNNSVAKLFIAKGSTWKEAATIANDRKKWKTFVLENN